MFDKNRDSVKFSIRFLGSGGNSHLRMELFRTYREILINVAIEIHYEAFSSKCIHLLEYNNTKSISLL